MALEVVTAGESHGPALTAIVVGLPAGLRLEKEAITPTCGGGSRDTAAARARSSSRTRSRSSPDSGTASRSARP